MTTSHRDIFAIMIGLISLVVLSGCGTDITVNDRNEYLAEQTRIYKNEDRERMLRAAEAVVRASGPGQYEFEFGLNGFSARHSYFIYGVVASAYGREKWDFNIEPGTAGLRATATLSDAGDVHGGLSISRYEKIAVGAPVYQLFWARVDYVLGRRPDWITCERAQIEKSAYGSLYGLCRSADEPVPEPLPQPRLSTRMRRG